MEELGTVASRFPRGLVEWAGHHSGGVKRLFDSRSGRPGKELLRTSLISRLEAWAGEVASGTHNAPRILLLVGGPGNGKTEAIEHTINCLDHGLNSEGNLVRELSAAFHPEAGKVARMVHIDAGRLAGPVRKLNLSIVQDASVNMGHQGRLAPGLLIDELLGLLDAPPENFYLCCVNRGVLDDALIYAMDNDLAPACAVLEAVTRSVSLSANAPRCWPLEGFPCIAVWPMDAESLLVCPAEGVRPPATILLEHAVDAQHWPVSGACAAGSDCPFCHSQKLLSREEHRAALLQILRWYELSSGKRWGFRDLFSLTSYLLAGNGGSVEGDHGDPCRRAARLLEDDKAGQVASKPRMPQLTALFHLVGSSYQHALFHRWDPAAAAALRQDCRDLGIDRSTSEGRTLSGLQGFLVDRKAPYLPATIASLLESVVDMLDPALASPDSEVAVSGRSNVLLGDLDTRFSRSLVGGIDFLQRYRVLSSVELDLLRRLAKADHMLSGPSVRRKKPAAASRIQRILRDFACRLARRSICTRWAVVADAPVLAAFQKVVEDDDKGQRLFEVAKQVKSLLNKNQNFEVSLTTTFGQPLPPLQRQATLVVPARPVRVLQLATQGRPRTPICFLQVGSGSSSQPIALTYDLFKALKELERGLSPASLPHTVVALLDTTRARLSGPIVRDQEILADARIRIGADGTEIGRSWNGFMASCEDDRA